MNRKNLLLVISLIVLAHAGAFCKDVVTLQSLLREMVSYDEATRIPGIPYSCRQVSSHDRRSVSPDKPGWFANDDGFGVERVDTVDGRIEKRHV